MKKHKVLVFPHLHTGFGIGGYDWPAEETAMRSAITNVGITAPFKMVNDVTLGLLAGTSEGWGVAVVSGTGCNCRGWDRDHKREGRVSGYGTLMGEGAGASELIYRTMQIIGYSWTKRLPPTLLSDAFIKHFNAKNLEGHERATSRRSILQISGVMQVFERVQHVG